MPIDFFNADCHSHSNKVKFGLFDPPDNEKIPACIKENDPNTWHGTINNPNEIDVNLYAIDHCIPIDRTDGSKSKRCDGMLHYGNRIVLVELKDSNTGRWPTKAREQLTETFQAFTDSYNIADFAITEAYICNKQRPVTNSNHGSNIERFKDDTGLLLKIQHEITIS
jgi:hypothetical protein